MDVLSATTEINSFFDKHADPFIYEYPLMNSYVPVLLLTIAYNAIVVFGPRAMESRMAFNLRGMLILYNLFVTLLSLYMSLEFALSALASPSYSISCFPVDRNGDSYGMRVRNVSWWYFISKIIEFADTFFFILRKKQSQVTFLHVYHHTNLAVFGWAGVKFVPTGETYFLAMLNSGVHVIMYFYYMMSAMGSQFQKYLWWKRYLTQVQLIQFVLIMVHYGYIAFFNQSCDFPRGVLIAYAINSISFFVLFMHFYRKAYNAKQKQQTLEKSENLMNNDVPTPVRIATRASPRKED